MRIVQTSNELSVCSISTNFFIITTSWLFHALICRFKHPISCITSLFFSEGFSVVCFLTCKREQKWFSVTFSRLLLLSFCSTLSISGELKANCTICTADAVPPHDIPWNSCMTLKRLDIHIPFIPKLHTNIKPWMHIKKSDKGEKQNF